ncbi:unnamed protein product [Caenorhabditis brenneri]
MRCQLLLFCMVLCIFFKCTASTAAFENSNVTITENTTTELSEYPKSKILFCAWNELIILSRDVSVQASRFIFQVAIDVFMVLAYIASFYL